MEISLHNTARKSFLMAKLVAITFLTGICVAASFSVLGLVMDRSHRADEAAAEIALKWSREQTINGPIITIPVRKTVLTAAGPQVAEDVIFLLPDSLQNELALESESRSRVRCLKQKRGPVL